MSSSGLIYAVIVGAWAAYLVPMWLRRQDELNEARPTERFSTAIRLLSGRAAMERRYAKGQDRTSADDASEERDPDDAADAVDARSFGVPAHDDRSHPAAAPGAPAPGELPSDTEHAPEAYPADGYPADGRVDARVPESRSSDGRTPKPSAVHGADRPRPSATDRTKRAKVLARRRRTITVLFLAFTLGAIAAAVGGIAFLWAPGIPAALLSAYIVYLRTQERRRFAFTMDQRQAEAAAQRLRERRPRPPQAAHQPPAEEPTGEPAADPAPEPAPRPEPAPAAGRRALVEQTDHAEWVDQQRPRGRTGSESWEPVPVPLPTYVTAPVAPRAGGHVDLSADDAWSSARSGAAGGGQGTPAGSAPAASDSARGAPAASGPEAERPAPQPRQGAGRRGRTPLFDQYAAPSDDDLDRPRAANE